MIESLDRFVLPKRRITRLFVGALVAGGVGLVLGVAALVAALATDAIDVGGGEVIDVNGGSGAWTALALVAVGSLTVLGATVAAVLSWLAALVNTWQLEDKLWFAALLVLGLLGLGVVVMVAYVVAGPDGTERSAELPWIATTARP